MKRHTLTLLLFYMTIGSGAVSAQSALFLLISPSVQFNGMGEIGVCLPSEVPSSSFYNPANGVRFNPGFSALREHQSAQWLPGLADDIAYDYGTTGINCRFPDKPLALSLRYQRTYLNAGDQIWTDPEGNIQGAFNTNFQAYSLAYSLRCSGRLWIIPYDISIGQAHKIVAQNLAVGLHSIESAGVKVDPSATNLFRDNGFLLTLPFRSNTAGHASLFFEPSYGQTCLNNGKDVVFEGLEDTDPPPLTAWAGLGDINFRKNILESRSTDKAVITRGHAVNLLDIYTLRFGQHIDVSGSVDAFHAGYGLQSTGMVRLLGRILDTGTLQHLNRHFTVSYDHSKWMEEPDHP